VSEATKPTRDELLQAVDALEDAHTRQAETFYLLGFPHGHPEMERFKGYYAEAKRSLVALIERLTDSQTD
jgi:hypothetical protein